jgi:transposase
MLDHPGVGRNKWWLLRASPHSKEENRMEQAWKEHAGHLIFSAFCFDKNIIGFLITHLEQ